MKKNLIAVSLSIALGFSAFSQEVKFIDIVSENGVVVSAIKGSEIELTPTHQPLFSFTLGENDHSSLELRMTGSQDSLLMLFGSQLRFSWKQEQAFKPGFKANLLIENIGKDTLELHNLVPFGQDESRVYITGKGRHYLSRTHLFRPGYEPVNVIVPDNAWNLGFSEIEFEDHHVFGLMRRGESKGAQIRRFENILLPGTSVTYSFYADFYAGPWQEGLRKAFQTRVLYDLADFDNSMYEREDLKWVRHSYAAHLLYGWDHQFYESQEGEFRLNDFLNRGKKWYGGDDFIGIWPTWPSLGLDQRNQWDLFRDLPGGLKQLNAVAEMCRSLNTRFFICYNPWDADTRSEGHYSGMADLIEEIGADGVVLDTQGSSSTELQRAADSVRKGVVMYSEGMAVPEDMPGIVSGRVHNALYYPPLLNLNKLIKPDFAIFRVAELAFEPIRREYATSFFNGYGTELNIFKPGRPDWIEEDYRFFGRTLKVLRENSTNFISYDFCPLLPTLTDHVYVNRWPGSDKTIFTIFSLIPEGFDGPLFRADVSGDQHVVDLWSHQEVKPELIDGTSYIPVRTEAFHRSWLGTNNEGAVSAIAIFPQILMVNLNIDRLNFQASKGEKILMWAGRPDYEKEAKVFTPESQDIQLREYFGRYEGDIVIQLFDNEELIDERIVTRRPGNPILISKREVTKKANKAPKGMIHVPSGSFIWETTNGDEFIDYPQNPYSGSIKIHEFYIDKYPVTNEEYYQFIKSSTYQPADQVNYLKHWVDGKPVEKDLKKPVVFISYEDAKAFAAYYNKRLPTELEWQYAAQTPAQLIWPWGNEKGIAKVKQFVTNTLTVSKITGVDSSYCNPGNGKLDPVGSYKKGANPLGIEDLVGSVWQLTNDEYDDGSYNFVMMKGGSYFNPGSSWWYVQGGPRELHYRQMLLRVSRGFERNGTVGFRCVCDK